MLDIVVFRELVAFGWENYKGFVLMTWQFEAELRGSHSGGGLV